MPFAYFLQLRAKEHPGAITFQDGDGVRSAKSRPGHAKPPRSAFPSKPDGVNNEHPGYANRYAGSARGRAHS